jgi:hypothetical protein
MIQKLRGRLINRSGLNFGQQISLVIPRTSLSPVLSDVGAGSDKRYRDRAAFRFLLLDLSDVTFDLHAASQAVLLLLLPVTGYRYGRMTGFF